MPGTFDSVSPCLTPPNLSTHAWEGTFPPNEFYTAPPNEPSKIRSNVERSRESSPSLALFTSFSALSPYHITSSFEGFESYAVHLLSSMKKVP